ncbi:LacI family transcriptional regulator [Alkalihalobacillus sp. MEB130]|uniref:LacI family DNA-binding transcriptional regulator n=1 Tax=Alkalihalobacillus sp. MEB130 TaxID=2976704 RepID=UPI0028DED0C2|nr:LacI family DNA-binding transcriptional regulator [Alkalihalobacillus sp. MEB130]MDT8858944.1 LacI family transcriptional regulator [Alkalihalobacillus sp. MEB130]
MVTIKNIAKELGVSVSTVSRAINNHPDINYDTKQEILETIKRLNYTPNALARSMIQKKTYTIGLMVPDITDLYFSAIAHDVEEVLSEVGYQIIYGNTGRNPEKEKNFLFNSLARKMDGLIVTPDFVDDDMIKWFQQIEIPVVFLRRRPPAELNIPFVDVDHYKGACQAMNYLHSLGHTNIGFIRMPEYSFTGLERYMGFKDSQEQKGIAPPYHVAIAEGKGMEDGARAMEQLLEMNPDLTAVFAGNDQLAIGAMEWMERNGIKVPEQISIVGFDNLELANLHWVQLTTVAQPCQDMGRKAALLLLDMLNEKNERPDSEILATSLVVRRSCKSLV